MPFVKVIKSQRTAGGDEPIVTLGAYLADGKHHIHKSISFRVNKPLIDKCGWKLDDDGRISLSVAEGTGDDVGFLQIVEDPKGYKCSQGRNRETGIGPDTSQGVSLSMVVERLKHYVLNECPVASDIVPHIVDGNALIIECPDWLRFNPQSVEEPEKEQPRSPLSLVKVAVKDDRMNRRERRATAAEIGRALRK
jgi:hypothetical protein